MPCRTISNRSNNLKWIINGSLKMQKEIKSVFSVTSKILSSSFSKRSKALRQRLREFGPTGKIAAPNLKISNNRLNSA